MFGNEELCLNPLYLACHLCGSLFSWGNFKRNEMIQANGKMFDHLSRSHSTETKSEKAPVHKATKKNEGCVIYGGQGIFKIERTIAYVFYQKYNEA